MPRDKMIKVRRGTTAQWATADAASSTDSNRLLADGEPGYDTSAGIYKIGDGVRKWAELPGFLNETALTSRIAATATRMTGSVTFPASLAVWGDSFVGSGVPTGQTAHILNRDIRGYWVHTLMILRQGLKLVHMGGVGGDTSAQVLARMRAYIATHGDLPAVNIITCGNNDALKAIENSDTVTFDNISEMASLVAAQGRLCVVTAVGPLSSNTTGLQTRLANVNNRLARKAATDSGFIFVDWRDVTQTGIGAHPGGWATDLTTDLIHPSPEAALRMGKKVADAIKHRVDLLDPLPRVGDSANLAASGGFMAGTGGALAGGATGVVATGWTAVGNNTPTVALTKIARTDGIYGEWQQVKLTSGSVSLQYTAGIPVPAAGTELYGVFEFETDDDLTASAGVSIMAGMVGVKQSWKYRGISYDGMNQPTQKFPPSSAFLRSGVMATEKFVVPAEDSSDPWRLIRPLVEISVRGTVRIGRVGIYIVGTGPLY